MYSSSISRQFTDGVLAVLSEAKHRVAPRVRIEPPAVALRVHHGLPAQGPVHTKRTSSYRHHASIQSDGRVLASN